ncbi:MAG: homocysteine S-methyltransferase family protein [Bacteroidota bacterium]|nr:homocysteine S-methyltransferase family protein [Bacteroidota bacterium]MDP4231762.1 homocysteine S-methyltransferase family protein [Bacteroidota bacterium]MDP4243498.1 homocysteine S-methyltransferase family protein [Bacteroidota bacterium]MDP4287099.1 homocysteine S-methyltransferase family protein [Bacteroidota bacterium]
MTRDLDTAFGVRPLVLDGALGTELEGRGVKTHGKSWTARGLITHPDLIYRVHKDYLWEGADIITANTFRTNPRALKGTGMDAEALTKKAVRIARRARREKNRGMQVAGSIAPVEDCFSPELVPASDAALIEEHRVMARWLDEARVDIILIETMNSIREALCALAAAKAESNKYVWVSLVPKDGETMLDGTPLDYAVKRLAEGGAHLVALNCAPLSVIMDALPIFSKAARRAMVWFGCYPNASEKRPDGSWDLYASSNKEITLGCLAWMQEGAVMVGSCCGTTPTTTGEIRTKRDLFYLNMEHIDLSEEGDSNNDMPF